MYMCNYNISTCTVSLFIIMISDQLHRPSKCSLTREPYSGGNNYTVNILAHMSKWTL